MGRFGNSRERRLNHSEMAPRSTYFDEMWSHRNGAPRQLAKERPRPPATNIQKIRISGKSPSQLQKSCRCEGHLEGIGGICSTLGGLTHRRWLAPADAGPCRMAGCSLCMASGARCESWPRLVAETSALGRQRARGPREVATSLREASLGGPGVSVAIPGR